jgi:hypothetical protein
MAATGLNRRGGVLGFFVLGHCEPSFRSLSNRDNRRPPGVVPEKRPIKSRIMGNFLCGGANAAGVLAGMRGRICGGSLTARIDLRARISYENRIGTQLRSESCQLHPLCASASIWSR